MVATLALPARPAGAHTPHDVILDIELSPTFADDDTAVAVVRDYLMRSTDGGDTWTRLINGLDHRFFLSSVEIAPRDPDVMYASSRGDGVFRSTDGGDSWARANRGLENRNVRHLIVSTDDADAVFALTPDGEAWMTSDGGASWSAPDGLVGEVTTAVAYAPGPVDEVLAGVDGAVMRSTDGGEGWDRVDLDADGAVTAIAYSPEFATDDTVHIGTAADGVFVSTDGGESFERREDGPDDATITHLELSPEFATDATIWATTWNDGVWRSTDGGESWEATSEGLTKTRMADDLGHPNFGPMTSGVDHDGAVVLMAGGYDGLFRSVDRAESWQEIETQDATNIVAFAVAPQGSEGGRVAVATYLNGAHRSDDGGGSWRPINDGITHRHEFERDPAWVVRLTSVTFPPSSIEGERLVLGSRGFQYDSNDGGESYERTIPEGLVEPGEYPPDFLVPASPRVPEPGDPQFAGTDSGGILRSSDDGITWDQIASIEHEVTVMAVSPGFDEDRTILVGTPEGVYRSTDAGSTWVLVEDSPKAVYSLALSSGFADDATAWVGARNGLWRSEDRGETWVLIEDQPFGVVPIEAVVASPNSAEGGIVLVSARGVGLFRSTDAGDTFEPIAPELIEDNIQFASFYHPTSEPIVFSPTFATDATIFAQAEFTLYRSTDAGDSWAPLTIPRFVETRDLDLDLLLTAPRIDGEPGSESHDGHEGESRTSASQERSSDRTVLTLSTKRVLAAVVAAAVAFVAMVLLKLRWRLPSRVVTLLLYTGLSGVVFFVVLFVVSNR